MKPLLLLLILVGAGSIAWLVIARPAAKPKEEKQQTISVAQHNSGFTSSVAAALDDYYKLTEAFVNWDSGAITSAATALQTGLAQLNIDELKKDSSAIYETAISFIENAKGDVKTILSGKGIRTQREAFNSLTENLYPFLNTVKYNKEKLYLQQCPMAFDDTKPGVWLSKEESIRNPYLGLHHPTYGKAMIDCGETKTTIDHTSGN